MCDLIVDFPQARSKVSSRPRRVRFSSEERSVRVYERPAVANPSEMYYSNQDYAAFQKANRRFVHDVHNMVSNYNDDGEPGDLDLTGIENLLTATLVKEAIARKAGRSQAVLNEQHRQNAAGYDSPDRLRFVSEHYSKLAVQRAQLIGMMNQS